MKSRSENGELGVDQRKNVQFDASTLCDKQSPGLRNDVSHMITSLRPSTATSSHQTSP